MLRPRRHIRHPIKDKWLVLCQCIPTRIGALCQLAALARWQIDIGINHHQPKPLNGLHKIACVGQLKAGFTVF